VLLPRRRAGSCGGPGRQPKGPDPRRHYQRSGPATRPEHVPDTLADVIHDLAVKQARLCKHINGHLESYDIHTLARLLQLHAKTASRLGRLLRDQRALSGEAADGISAAIGQALDELSTELGTGF